MPFSGRAVLTIATTFLVLSVPAASAQQPSKLRQLCEGISTSLTSFEWAEMAEDQSHCIIHNGVMNQNDRFQWHFKRLVIRGEYGTSGRAYPQLPPRGIFVVEDVIPLTGRLPGQDYITRHVANPVTYQFTYGLDPKAGLLHIAELSATSKSGRLVLGGKMKVDFDLKAELLAFEDYARDTEITEISLSMTNSGLFESLALPVVVSFIGFDVDPEPKIKQWQKELSDGIDALPGSAVSARSKAALKKFIGEFPHPAGPIKATLKFNSPVSAAAVRRGEISALELLKAAMIDAVYE